MASALPIILQVLKIVGFVLLGILGLLIFIILLVCLVPVRYKGKIQYDEKANGFFKISWLLNALQAKVIINDNQPETKIRILGFIKIGDDMTLDDLLSMIKNKGDSQTDAPTEEDEAEEENTEGTVLFEDADGNVPMDDETADTYDELISEAVKDDYKNRRTKPTFFEFYKEKTNEWYVKINLFIRSIPDRLKEKWAEFKLKYKDLKKKYKFFTSTRAKRAYKHVLKNLWKLLKHMFPRKIKGEIHFGLPSPADTGTVYGILSGLIPFRKDQIIIYPNFEEKEFNADVTVKGRIFIGRVLLIVLVMLLNKDVIYMLKRVKKVLQ